MKTLKEWKQSKLDMDIFLDTPCEIDEGFYLRILESVPVHYATEYATQGGDPVDSFENHKGKTVYTYMTVRNVNGKFFYLGILPEFKS